MSPQRDEGLRAFKVTLTWTDPYTSATSGTIILHNLDLLLSNDRTNALTYPNGRSSADSLNTVEKIVVYNPESADVYTVSVTATTVTTTATQNYALVASGWFAGSGGSYGTWYCQSASANRPDELYTPQACWDSCDAYERVSRCCHVESGGTCEDEEVLGDEASCDAVSRPWDCVAPTPGGGHNHDVITHDVNTT